MLFYFGELPDIGGWWQVNPLKRKHEAPLLLRNQLLQATMLGHHVETCSCLVPVRATSFLCQLVHRNSVQALPRSETTGTLAARVAAMAIHATHRCHRNPDSTSCSRCSPRSLAHVPMTGLQCPRVLSGACPQIRPLELSGCVARSIAGIHAFTQSVNAKPLKIAFAPSLCKKSSPNMVAAHASKPPPKLGQTETPCLLLTTERHRGKQPKKQIGSLAMGQTPHPQ